MDVFKQLNMNGLTMFAFFGALALELLYSAVESLWLSALKREVLSFPLCTSTAYRVRFRSGFTTPQPADSWAVSWLSAPLRFGIDKVNSFVIYGRGHMGNVAKT